MKKIISVILLISIFFVSPFQPVKAAYADNGGLWDFLWDLAVDAAIDYAIDHADEIVNAVSNAFSDSSSSSSNNDNYYSRRIVADYINVREKPDKKSQALTQLQYGQKLHVHETTGENMKWSFIETQDNVKGWVSSDYIAPLAGKAIPVKTTARINLRMSPEAKSSWNVIGQIEKDTQVLMIRRWTVKDRIWFYVQTPSNITGWISSKYVQ